MTMEEIKYQVTAANPFGSYEFDVNEDLAQIELNLTTSIKPWYHLFVIYEGQQVGQILITHKQDARQVLIGKTVATSSATVFPSLSLVGHWEIKFFGSQIETASEELKINRIDHLTTPVIDAESQQDVVRELASQPSKSGWVKGDFHTHTIYSDGMMTRQANIESAKEQGLDFFVATEHNVVTALWPRQDEVAIFGGCELTTPFGHTNFLGLERPLLDATGMPGFVNETALMQVIEANRDNGLMSINHPFLDPWDWTLDVPLAYVTSMELINDPTYSDNDSATVKAFDLWSALWNHGWQITGIGGSDSHLLPDDKYPDANMPSLIGDPATYVMVESLTRDNVLAGIKAKHTKVSRFGEIMLTSVNQADLLPGQQVSAAVRSFTLQLPNTTPVGYVTEWVLDGAVVASTTALTSTYTITPEIDLTEYHWLRADVKDQNGVQQATFTPVFWGERTPTITTYQEVLVHD